MKTTISSAKILVAWIVAFALFMENLDTTIINTTVPQMAHSLHVNPINLKVVLTSYLISLAIFIPISGWIADKFGTRKTFCFAICIFTLGSICCGLSDSLVTLILSRLLQGFGGALMTPVGRLIVWKTFSKSELVRATNYVSMPAILGPALGPLLGGVIANYFSWRWIFFINVPFGIVGLILALKHLSNYQVKNVNPLDISGFILFGTGLAALAFSLEILGESVLSASLASMIIYAGILILLLYFWHSRGKPYPIVDLSLFKINTFKFTIFGSFVSRLGASSLPFLLPLLYQIGFGLSPLQSGLLTFPLAISMFIMKIFVKDIVKRFSFRKTLIVNTVLLGISITAFSLINKNTPYWCIIMIVFIQGALSSLQYSCMNVLSYVDLDDNNLSKGTSIGSTIQQLAASFGIAIGGLFLKYFLGPLKEANPARVIAFHRTFMIMGLFTFFSALIFVKLQQDAGAAAGGKSKKAQNSTL